MKTGNLYVLQHRIAKLGLILAMTTGGVAEVHAAWTIKVVDDVGNTGNYGTSLALDQNDVPHISYMRTTSDLYYATKSNNKWTVEPADTYLFPGYYSSLAFDSSGTPMISYVEYYSSDVKFAKKVNGVWTTRLVDTAGGYDTSIAYSPGYICMSWYSAPNYGGGVGANDLRVGRSADGGATWAVDTVDSTGDVGMYTSTSFDPYGRCVVTYYDVTNGNLKAATRQDAFSWAVTTVATTDNVGLFSSSLVDPNNILHIAHYNSTYQDLTYTTWTGSQWLPLRFESAGANHGVGTSIARNFLGYIHIAYYNATDGDLKYAWQTASGWSTTTVDSTGNVGMYPSLKLDRAGVAHISYFDATNQNLKYATGTP